MTRCPRLVPAALLAAASILLPVATVFAGDPPAPLESGVVRETAGEARELVEAERDARTVGQAGDDDDSAEEGFAAEGSADGAPEDGGPQDGGPQDGGPQDGGPQDGGPQDGGPQDGGPQDGAPEDGGPQDDSTEFLPPTNDPDTFGAIQDRIGMEERSERGDPEDPPAAINWHAQLPEWLDLDAEYRARTTYINPLELSGNRVESIDWTVHRMRLGVGFKHGGWLAIRTRMDVLDGVLWGDNGSFSSSPQPNSGLSIATRRPNETAMEIGLRPGADPLDPESYQPQLAPADTFQVDHLYADVVLPFGLLRVGRQPASYGASLGGHDGERYNRWGASSFGDIADRFLFGTKLDEAVRVIRGDGGEIDPSLDNGIVLASWVDLYNTGDVYQAGDNLRQHGLVLSFNLREADWFGYDWRSLAATMGMIRMTNDDFDTGIWAFPFIVKGQLGPFRAEGNLSYITGSTREMSEGLAVLNPRPATSQDLRALGARAVVDVELGPAMLTLEFDYARGDDDPRQESTITSYSFPRDLNVGLLMFEHILAYESARRAAVGVENLRNLDAPSFPLTEASTEGRFTNAVAFFPQVNVDWVDQPEHRFNTRFGVLFAWPEAFGGAVDPVMTSLAEDGIEISDDAVNYHGGDPGSYYGTEFDLQLGWRYRQNFFWTVEGAVLLPGSSLEDENGDAVNSFMLENRFEFVF